MVDGNADICCIYVKFWVVNPVADDLSSTIDSDWNLITPSGKYF